MWDGPVPERAPSMADYEDCPTTPVMSSKKEIMGLSTEFIGFRHCGKEKAPAICRRRAARWAGSVPCGGYEGSASTMPAATVFDVASSIRMKLPVVRLRA